MDMPDGRSLMIVYQKPYAGAMIDEPIQLPRALLQQLTAAKKNLAAEAAANQQTTVLRSGRRPHRDAAYSATG